MKIELTKTSSWKKLEKHYETIKKVHLKDLFKKDPNRFRRFSIVLGPILFDYSKNIITEKTIKLLCALADELNLKKKIKQMFEGEKINITEKRSVLHTALRSKKDRHIIVEGKNIMNLIHELHNRIKKITTDIRDGKWMGVSGAKIEHIVNIGIGGSCLGPKMVTHALKYTPKKKLKIHFLSNIDPLHVQEVLNNIQPEKTLFIISSKSFKTQETMENALFVKKWFLTRINPENTLEAINKHFIAITNNIKAAKEFGILEKNILPIWEWIGGRFSLWSSIGLSIALFTGIEEFEKLLEGANMVDEHFFSAPLNQNIPVLMALLSIWYNNFFNTHIHMVAVYSEALKEFPSYLQQLEMESNGKSVTLDGKQVSYPTGYIVVGGTGTEIQHSMFQLLHQGTHIIPCDFIVFANNNLGMNNRHHKILISHCFAQTKALMEGKENNHSNRKNEIHKHISGNNPSNTFLIKSLSPYSLGALIALYEHKVFVEGVIWNINSFDQWGVELGKKIANDIFKYLSSSSLLTSSEMDSSTYGLLQHYLTLSSKFLN